jgi:hypothetical protein
MIKLAGQPLDDKFHTRGSVRQFGPGFFFQFSFSLADLL